MVNLSNFMPHILPYVQGCSYPMAEQFIRNVCIDFCNHAPVIQEKLDPISLIVGQSEYDYDAPNGTAVTHVLGATCCGVKMGIHRLGDSDDSIISARLPSSLRQTGTNTFCVNVEPTESIPRALILTVALKPTNSARTVHDILFDDYAQDIAKGVIAQLVRIPGWSFTAPELASQFQQDYQIARTNARIRAERSFGLSADKVNYRRFI